MTVRNEKSLFAFQGREPGVEGGSIYLAASPIQLMSFLISYIHVNQM